LAECHYCGKMVPNLYPVTAEDIQREHPPPAGFHVACGECLDKIRSVAHLVPEYSITRSIQDIFLMVPLFSVLLVLAAIGVSTVRGHGLGEVERVSQWLGIATVLSGTMMVWDRSKNRYAITHDLRWSLNSKRVILAFAIVLAGVIVSILSVIVPW
jgi:hypothetical protein